MKAVRCHAWGPPDSLVVDDLPTPHPQAGEVLLDVRAASVNYPDVLIIQKKYQMQPALPFTPGTEVAGTVRALGDGVTNVKVGDRVIAFLGLGGFAEQAIAQADEGDHPVADGDVGDAGAEGAHGAGDLGAGRERQLGLDLVLLLDDQHVGVVDRRRLHVEQHLAGLRQRRRQVVDDEAVGRSPGMAADGFHGRFPRLVLNGVNGVSAAGPR